MYRQRYNSYNLPHNLHILFAFAHSTASWSSHFSMRTFLNQPNIRGVASFVPECLALFPWFVLKSFWFNFRIIHGIGVLAFVTHVSVEKFKMRSMCFSFASVLKCASCAWDTKTFLKECLRLCMRLLLRALNLFLSWLVITVSLILRSMQSWIKTHTDSSSLYQI